MASVPPNPTFFQRWAARLFGQKPLSPPLASTQSACVKSAKKPDRPVPEPLFDDWTLPLPPVLSKRIKADVAQRLPCHAQPSLAQWRMILSRTPATLVVAGAGAGKSTSLVLRLLVLNHYLGIDLASMTVITFTRESRRDFIKKTVYLFDLWGISLSNEQVSALVRTFHSRLLPLIRSLPGLAQVRAFETLDDAAADAGGNPFDLRINPTQRRLLNQCYSELLAAQPQFRQLIGTLRLRAMRLDTLAVEHPEVQKRMAVTALAARRDEELCDLIEDHWFRAGAWPIDGIEPQRKPISINGSEFCCHGYIAELDAWVVLGFDPLENRQATRSGAKLPVAAEWAVKRTLFQAFCDKPLIWLSCYEEGRRLWGALTAASTAGPGFEYQLQGDLSAAPLLDAFFASASFIESLGLGVAETVAAMNPLKVQHDLEFFQALAWFWPALQVFLQRQVPVVMTYNAMFRALGEGNSGNLEKIPDSVLQPMTHLMIDEFQDISPQIVSWLRASLKEVRRRAKLANPTAMQHTSLLGVGDDWQSIYGWRGSSPHFFLQFKQEFPAVKATRVLLVENFRSHQYIVEAAEHMVRVIRSLPGKKGTALGPQTSQPVPVQVLTRDDPHLAQQVGRHYQNGDSILILFRRTSDKCLIDRHISEIVKVDSSRPVEQRRLRLMTYHSAKGLQADAVFLVGDCRYSGVSPYRNEAYRIVGWASKGQADAYDAAQRDEALRLAYVAITRAVRHCYWYMEPTQREPEGSLQASAQVPTDKPYFRDLRRA